MCVNSSLCRSVTGRDSERPETRETETERETESER